MLSVAEAARYLRVSQSTLWRWINTGTVNAHRIGPKRVWLNVSDLGQLAQPARPLASAPPAPRPGTRNEPAMSPRDREQALAAIEAARAFQAEVLARRGGEPLGPSWELIDEAREARSRELT
jgi:excisionase family DNA binding protein